MSPLALSDAQTIVTAVIGFLVIVALLVFARLMLAKVPPTYRRYRFGVFVERDGDASDGDGDSPPQHDT
jgi:hypothetical protein